MDVTVTLELWTSSFCGACTATRRVLERAGGLLGDRVTVVEHNVADLPEDAGVAGITVTPTVIVRGADGAERTRASGTPTIDHVLVAVDAAAR